MSGPSNHPITSEGTSGRVTDVMSRSKQEDKYGVAVIAAVFTVLALGVAGYWVYRDVEEIGPGRVETRGETLAGTWNSKASPVPASSSVEGELVTAVADTQVPAGLREADLVEVDVYFDFDSIGLTEQSKAVLKREAEELGTGGGWRVAVQGYTDQVGRSSYNQALGMKRAEAAKAYLVELGVPDHLIHVSSMGQQGALCDESTSPCRQRNRRAHLVWSKQPTSARSERAIVKTPAEPPASLEGTVLASDRSGEDSSQNMTDGQSAGE